ncbi:enoyl-CoA hydratase/isomerase family protein [Pseudonocardia oceani]|uniref:Enoyl-CoA hydratase/isomerase family protein n=2 Tax=Pseudonocardia oceani TaxID=2792013 RepID=A0ABS6U2C1_9PSEU|nr:enoyl-CoA hydratase-related protein [Pseudonocardia oceani]MBW0092519.1 enoyl-CoA hydratase/isomerase family protein [Pseudonocardia oceani]MBW0111871.1 enoyl-CoA hydratase/isomerase family protein [Pseudonocardia oceani]MBW0120586.1 enoyl-CoA hydratase/isomerase family protein [Pseudonocardia oceani]MBW0126259.1 enoyl-CoA hydratase/isomerase family protein [Pseudonocardia oceani]
MTNPPAGTVSVEHDGAVATVALDRPDRLNALDLPTRRALVAALRELAADEGVRAVVLTGTGRAFCVGQDLTARNELAHADETIAATYNPLAQTIAAMPQPVVAAVNGPAVGAGMGLALACDLRLAADSASFSCAFGRVGLVPDTGVSWYLVRELGHARAFDLATSGRPLPAAEALALGLVNEVVPDAALPGRAAEVAARLAAGPAHAFALTKRQFRAAGEVPLESLLAMEARHQGSAAAHPDHLEGLAAVAGKRASRWRERAG